MWNAIFNFYQYTIFIYMLAIVIIYLTLVIMSLRVRQNHRTKISDYYLDALNKSPYAPGISIVAPAFNEERTIVINIKSMLSIDYPVYEVVIVNDGSTDQTLEKMIEAFELVETPYLYIEKIKSKPFKRIFKSTNPLYEKLTIVDKVNGGTKADASNAGVNVAKYPYFICTDVDCILAQDALSRMVLPILQSPKRVIAVGATMRMVNSCKISTETGRVIEDNVPTQIWPMYQEVEYLRSYLVGKSGWSKINAVPNVSGGLGLFDKSVVISIGGYDPLSHAEDMDLTFRMIAYMRDYNKEYVIKQIPETCCWTEGPSTLRVLNRQRTRWARGLLQCLLVHRRFMLNAKYGRLGLITYPYMFFFEFMAPIIEAVGILFTIYLLFNGGVNQKYAFIMLFYVYMFSLCISITALFSDARTEFRHKSMGSYIRIGLATLVEAIIYHPLIVFFSIKGYINFLTRKNFKWGQMTRQGFDNSSEREAKTV